MVEVLDRIPASGSLERVELVKKVSALADQYLAALNPPKGKMSALASGTPAAPADDSRGGS